MFENKKIAVMGGTGTIGSLIVDYLITQNPSVIRVFSNDEDSLWKAQQRWGYGATINMRYLLGDIRSIDRCLLALKGIDYVFNCAAIKHVPIAEYNPSETKKTNIDGLDNIINASVYRNVEKLLHISTDKAVNPTTVMGATKMISERILQIRWSQNPETNMICVRMGNILDSRGSILPKIREQKAKGLPITITNPEMERFWMSQKECVEFIMNAFKNGKNGEIWVPKLREKKLMDIVREEVGIDYPIEIIGNRKGEKLREELLSDHEIMIADQTKRDVWVIPNEV